MKQILIQLICALVFMFSNTVHATQGVEGGSASSRPSVRAAADQTAQDNAKGQALSAMTGAALIGTGSALLPNPATNTAGKILIGMGALSVLQAVLHGDTAKQAADTSFNTDGYGNPYGINDPYKVILDKDPSVIAMKSNLDKLQKKGIYDPAKNTVKIDGKDYNVKDFGSSDSMAAAGMPKSGIEQAMSAYGEIEKKIADKIDKVKIGALTSAAGYDDQGGGGSKVSADSSADSAGIGATEVSGMRSLASQAGLGGSPTAFAGMQKNYNGDPIGVSGDSIFLMMNRRYKTKENQDAFLNETDLALRK